jgi:lactoylglutathione lyase
MRLGYAIVFVSDMQRSLVFYRDLLGLPVRFESSHWTELATEGATLALHLGDEPAAERAGEGEAPGSCRPGFHVADLDALHQRLVAAGVTCKQEPKDVFGSRVALYLDPDGLQISVGEQRGG